MAGQYRMLGSPRGSVKQGRAGAADAAEAQGQAYLPEFAPGGSSTPEGMAAVRGFAAPFCVMDFFVDSRLNGSGDSHNGRQYCRSS
jgi:hypothetical protein